MTKKLIDANTLLNNLKTDPSLFIAKPGEEAISINRFKQQISHMLTNHREMGSEEWNEFRSSEVESTDQYGMIHREVMWDCELPDDCDDILVSDGKYVWQDTFYNMSEDGCELESGLRIEDGMAWMPMPEPHRRSD